ncbi:GNAT family N-acetyltransferase [Pseudomarimonas salicorniae]|uniref:GNAT family N-acetyltransferase n=1 Tax=Pseudomarimonas salicorniae TaxID=2933270 RepID=A0ABT0GI59_9GAMM|nr:GNAT family N-acetyltransferase [Lysobacter sp. CAU 1642]MCK7593712.1 GNAT family N-acetyltransferase [Lysobacter sp. CAU 1642]
MDAHLEASGIRCTAEDNLARVMHRFDCAEVLCDGGEPIGLLKLARGTDSWEIIQLQLGPRMQGQGAGSRLLQQLIAEAESQGVALTLKVLKANPARFLYAKLGFETVGEDDHEFLMQRPAPG